MIRRLMATRRLDDSRALVDYIVKDRAPRSMSAQVPTSSVVAGWAQEVNVLARTVTYGWLPINVPMERSNTFALASCDENNHVSRRMAELNVKIDAAYDSASVSVILSELRRAAERLAAVMKATFPEAGR